MGRTYKRDSSGRFAGGGGRSSSKGSSGGGRKPTNKAASTASQANKRQVQRNKTRAQRKAFLKSALSNRQVKSALVGQGIAVGIIVGSAALQAKGDRVRTAQHRANMKSHKERLFATSDKGRAATRSYAKAFEAAQKLANGQTAISSKPYSGSSYRTASKGRRNVYKISGV